MQLREYQDQAAKTAVFPEKIGYLYVMLGLSGEVGELCNKFKKILRGDYGTDEKLLDTLKKHPEIDDQLADELGDILWYIAMIANTLGYDLGEIAKGNLEKLADRQARGVLKGSGDDR